MKRGELRKKSITEKMADYILDNGLQNASLRNLATAAETSDRMLLHYFKDKEDLLTATLNLICERFIELLDSVQLGEMKFNVFLTYIPGMMKDVRVRPYLKLWLELATLSSREEYPFRTIAQQIFDSFSAWVTSTLKVENENERISTVALTLATVEGFVFLDALGYDSKISEALEGITHLYTENPNTI